MFLHLFVCVPLWKEMFNFIPRGHYGNLKQGAGKYGHPARGQFCWDLKTRTRDITETCPKGHGQTPKPALKMRVCCLCAPWFLFTCPHPPPQRGLSISHHLTHSAKTDGRLTWLYRDFAREISSWSPGVHMFKPMGSIFLSAATMREVWMEYKSPLRLVFFRSWSCPPD